MADDNTSERNVTIESNVNVGTASGETTVSGVKVSVGSARDIHVHGDTTPPSSFRSVALVSVLAFLGAVLVNIATSQLPPGLQPYLWFSWPLAIVVTAASIWVAYRQSRSATGSITLRSSLEQRNRRAMLTKVKTIWIGGLLEKSLAKELRLALELTEQPDAVDLPLNALVRELQHPPRALPAGTPIIDVFDKMGGTLLILGAPGAGKTTLLLELARDLIERAEQDEGHPIPVVFNLSSWATKRPLLNDWLVEELKTKYDVPRKVAQVWTDTDIVLPLLDGLDEIAAEYRSACVEAINTYRQEHGLVPLTVCSRVADYSVLDTRLRLQGAIVVQTLTQPQADTYLERAGEKLAGVRAALRDDAELGEMLDTPLMLSIVVLAYAGKAGAEVQAAGTPDERRRHLFDAYIAAMFERRGERVSYSPQQTTHWLSLLAGYMVQHSQTVYYIERMQPDWIPHQQQRTYARTARLSVGLAIGLVIGLVSGLFGDLRGALVIGLVIGLLTGLAFTVERIKITETLRWSLRGLLAGLGGGLVFGLGYGLIYGLNDGLVFGLGVGLLAGLFGGLSGNEIEARTVPNQGIRRSARSWLVLVLVFGLVYGLVYGLFSVLVGGLVYGLLSVLALGLIYALDYGGHAVFQHYTLRWLLYRNGSLPFRLVPFLDYCAERIFLRKVGGGYIFVHRLLMEHFASLYTDQPATPPK